MRSTLRSSTLLTLACMLQGCASAAPEASPNQDAGPPPEAMESRLYRWLAGRYDSSKQAAADRSYYAIDLTMCAVDAPQYGARTLYVEQAMSGRAPYRQRLYVVEPVAGVANAAKSRVFEFNDPTKMVAFCKSGKATLPEGVVAEAKAGCEVILTWDEGRQAFTGGTTGKTCASTLNGASYTSSEVVLESARLVSWDRGFDANDQQVWGATKGGYVFDRLDAPVAP